MARVLGKIWRISEYEQAQDKTWEKLTSYRQFWRDKVLVYVNVNVDREFMCAESWSISTVIIVFNNSQINLVLSSLLNCQNSILGHGKGFHEVGPATDKAMLYFNFPVFIKRVVVTICVAVLW